MAKTGSKQKRFKGLSIEICILAGGSSKRMGRDKSRLRLGATTMLGHIRKAARATGLPVRIIRRDCVPKCGPLSGIYTALKTTNADAILFLACDMPLVSTELIQLILQLQPHVRRSHSRALFVRSHARAGFPFVLPREAIVAVRRQIQLVDYSLQSLANTLQTTILPLSRPWSQQLFNVNSQKDWTVVRKRLRRTCSPVGEARSSLHLGRN
jgi:molybdopterin-guanine dinucleotide biosynthesis protein A